MYRLLVALLLSLPIATHAESPSISLEDLKAQVDKKVSDLDEYRALLNDPDPARARAALQVMIASGDPVLQQMAVETGLLSADVSVRRSTMDYFMGTRPTLLVRLDGASIEGLHFFNTVTKSLDGAIGPNKEGTILVSLGEFSAEHNCYLYADQAEQCAVSLGVGEVFVEAGRFMSASFTLGEQGTLVGYARLLNVSEGVPAKIQLLEQ